MSFKAQPARACNASALCDPIGDVSTPAQPLGHQLKSYFDELVIGPTPDRLLHLTEQLEAALERGELRCGGRPHGVR